MRYLLAALALLALAGCADYGDSGYAYNGYSPAYTSGYAYNRYSPAYRSGDPYNAPDGYDSGFYAQTAPYGSDNCGTPYRWKACPAW